MRPAGKAIRKHIVAAMAACLFVSAAYAVMCVSSTENGATAVIGMLLLPGTTLGFFVGGGMSSVDGLTPAWRDDVALVLGFLLNAILVYGVCLFMAKMAKIIREELRTSADDPV